MSKYAYVCLGGTFNHLHKGHKVIIETAFTIGDKVLIGLADEHLIKNKEYHNLIESYEERERKIRDFLAAKGWLDRVEIVPISDVFGPAVSIPDLDAIIVSEETERRALEINEIREKKGLKKLDIIVIKLVKAENGKPISSTRIRKGEIDTEGRQLNIQSNTPR
ncbi:MAG: pantetheine-phosphate adenylyltransferase [Candidatus Methanomethylicia archaeon]